MPQRLGKRVLDYIRKHDVIRAGDRLGVAVSGGADSVALLRLLLELRSELGIVLSAVHFNHGIRGDAADVDEQFVRQLAAAYGLEIHASSADTPAHAKQKKMSLEAAARQLRYGYFESLIRQGALNKVATAHTLDDQAETVLLRVIRGTGTTGLAGIYPLVEVGGTSSCAIVRPLLQVRRPELESYLNRVGQSWCDDATNLDTTYTRNRVRHSLLPLLEREFNPAVRDRLAELAEIAREEEAFWCEQVKHARELVAPSKNAGAAPSSQSDTVRSEYRVSANELLKLPVAVQRRTLRELAEALELHLDFKHVDDLLSLARAGAKAQLNLPGGATAECRVVWGRGRAPSRLGAELILRRASKNVQTATPPASRHAPLATDYSYVLPVPGEVMVPELGSVICARLVEGAGADRLKAENIGEGPGLASYNGDQLLDCRKLTSPLTVRNWRPGDRFWPEHSASPKKIKELLQACHITGGVRHAWPVIVSGDDVVWLRNFGAAQGYRAPGASEGAVLLEIRSL